MCSVSNFTNFLRPFVLLRYKTLGTCLIHERRADQIFRRKILGDEASQIKEGAPKIYYRAAQIVHACCRIRFSSTDVNKNNLQVWLSIRPRFTPKNRGFFSPSTKTGGTFLDIGISYHEARRSEPSIRMTFRPILSWQDDG